MTVILILIALINCIRFDAKRDYDAPLFRNF